MAVYRVEKSHDFTVMANYHLRDPRLKLGAKGLLSLVLSLPEDWEYSVEGLAALGPEGKDAVRSAIRQLESAGYITRQRSHSEGGQFAGNIYIIREKPEEDPPLAAFPTMGKPTAGKPTTGNPPQINKDKQIPPKAPQGGRRGREAKDAPDWKPERFAGFWAFYPRGEAKQAAIRAWDKLAPDDKLIETMGKALKRQKQSADWLAGVGVPYASTWLNQRRWEDEDRGGSDGSEGGVIMPEGPIWN